MISQLCADSNRTGIMNTRRSRQIELKAELTNAAAVNSNQQFHTRNYKMKNSKARCNIKPDDMSRAVVPAPGAISSLAIKPRSQEKAIIPKGTAPKPVENVD